MSKILDKIISNLGNFRKHFKIQLPDGSNDIFFGADSGVTTGIGIWGNSTNKVAVRATNSQDDARYNFLVRQSYLALTYRPSGDSSDTTLYTIPAPSYFFGGSANTDISASSNLDKFTTLPITRGPVSTSDWTVSSNRASSTVSGTYKVEGYVSFAPSSSGTTTSIVARLHIGSDYVVSRNASPAGALVTTHIGPVIINIGAGTKVYWDISATVAGETRTSTNLSTLTIVRVN